MQPIDLVSAVKELHKLGSQELSKLIRDADNDTIQWAASDGSPKQVGRFYVESYYLSLSIQIIFF